VTSNNRKYACSASSFLGSLHHFIPSTQASRCYEVLCQLVAPPPRCSDYDRMASSGVWGAQACHLETTHNCLSVSFHIHPPLPSFRQIAPRQHLPIAFPNTLHVHPSVCRARGRKKNQPSSCGPLSWLPKAVSPVLVADVIVWEHA
jgi:hypothetical protein